MSTNTNLVNSIRSFDRLLVDAFWNNELPNEEVQWFFDQKPEVRGMIMQPSKDVFMLNANNFKFDTHLSLLKTWNRKFKLKLNFGDLPSKMTSSYDIPYYLEREKESTLEKYIKFIKSFCVWKGIELQNTIDVSKVRFVSHDFNRHTGVQFDSNLKKFGWSRELKMIHRNGNDIVIYPGSKGFAVLMEAITLLQNRFVLETLETLGYVTIVLKGLQQKDSGPTSLAIQYWWCNISKKYKLSYKSR